MLVKILLVRPIILFYVSLLSGLLPIGVLQAQEAEKSRSLVLGLKVTPTQFFTGEVAATAEVKLNRSYSFELKSGIFGQDKYQNSLFLGNVAERLIASGWLTQVGAKKYLNKQRAVERYQDFSTSQWYLQGLFLYKNSSFGLHHFDEPDGVSRSESQSIHTYGLKFQVGYETQVLQYFYAELYGGIGYRVRDISRVIYAETSAQRPRYPASATKIQSYFTPQLGLNLDFQLPVQRKSPILKPR